MIKSEKCESALGPEKTPVSIGLRDSLDLAHLSTPSPVRERGSVEREMVAGAARVTERAVEAFSRLEQVALPPRFGDIEAYGKGLGDRLDLLQRLSVPDAVFEIENPPTTHLETLEAVMRLPGFAKGLPSKVVEGIKDGKLSHMNGVMVAFQPTKSSEATPNPALMGVYSLIPRVRIPGALPNVSRVVSSLAHGGTLPGCVAYILSAVELAVERGPMHYARTWGALALNGAGFGLSAWLGYAGFRELALVAFTASLAGPSLLNRWNNHHLNTLKWINAADRLAMSPWSQDPFHGACADRELLFGKRVGPKYLDEFSRKSRDSLRALRHLGVPEEEINRAVYSTAYDPVSNEAVEVQRLLKTARRERGLSSDGTFEAVMGAKESMLEIERGITRRLARAIASTYVNSQPESEWLGARPYAAN